MGVDRRIITKYLHRLIEDNKHIHSSEKLNLHIGNHGNVQLAVPAAFDKNAFKALYYERSICFKLMIDILMENFLSIEDFAERNFISIPSVYRKFPYLKEQLQVLQVDLDLKGEKKFVGAERQIRLFYFYLLSDVQDYLGIPNFLTIEGQRRYDSFSNLWLTITYFRIRSKNYINETDELDKVETLQMTEAAFNLQQKDSLRNFFSVFSLDNTTLSAEQHCLYIVFNSVMGLSLDRASLSEIDAPENTDQLKTDIEKLSYLWVKLFMDFFQVPVSKENFNYMYQVLVHGHATSYIFQRKVRWIYRMSDYGLVILNNENLDKKIDCFFDLLREQPAFQRFAGKEFTFSLSLGYTFYIHSFLTTFQPPVKIHTFAKLGQLSATYLQNTIIKFTRVPVSFIENHQQADLIVTDTYNPFSTDLPVLHVQPMPQEDELIHIQSTIEKTYYDTMLKNEQLIL
nr:helix-turn-helix domain-containing protein [Enterococcus larvae]